MRARTGSCDSAAHQALGAIPGQPPVSGTHTHPTRLARLSWSKAVLSDAKDKKFSTKRYQTGISILWCFIRALWRLDRCGNRHFPKMPRKNNLSRDHS